MWAKETVTHSAEGEFLEIDNMGVRGGEESFARFVHHGMEVDQDHVDEIGLEGG